jgi:hypothetical protein
VRRPPTPMARRVVAALATALLALPAAASADGGRVIRDCTDDGRVQGHYSQSEYRDALAHMPSDVDEYTDCRDVIRRAQLAAARGSGGGNGSGGAKPPVSEPPAAGTDPLAAATPQERAGVDKAVATARSAPVKIGHTLLRPGTLGTRTSSAVSDIPTPLLIALILVAAGALTLAGARIRGRVLARRDS